MTKYLTIALAAALAAATLASVLLRPGHARRQAERYTRVGSTHGSVPLSRHAVQMRRGKGVPPSSSYGMSEQAAAVHRAASALWFASLATPRAPVVWTMCSGSGFDMLTSDGGSGNAKEFMYMPKAFVDNVVVAAVHEKDWERYKYHMLDVLYWHWESKTVKRGEVYVMDTCVDSACPDGAGSTCCTTNAAAITKVNKAYAPFVLDLERHGTMKKFGFDLMGSEQANPGVIAMAFVDKGYRSPKHFQARYSSDRKRIFKYVGNKALI